MPHGDRPVSVVPEMALLQKSRLYRSRAHVFTRGSHRICPNVFRNHEGKDTIAWVGHATFLIRTAGVTWLTDPMLSKRALLPKRVTPPALTKEELKQISGPLYVLISHNHYDHLDKDTIASLTGPRPYFCATGAEGNRAGFLWRRNSGSGLVGTHRPWGRQPTRFATGTALVKADRAGFQYLSLGELSADDAGCDHLLWRGQRVFSLDIGKSGSNFQESTMP